MQLHNQPMMNLADLIEVMEHLADLLDEESEYLRAMQIKKVAPLHEEKIRLTQRLEAYQRLLDANPKALGENDPKLEQQFVALSEEFAAIVKDNFRLNAVARTVNLRVVQAISDALFEEQRPAVYNRQGTASMTGDLTMSFNLNQRA